MLDELLAALERMKSRFEAIGDADTDEAHAARGRLYLETATYFGYMALISTPGAKNYVVCSIRFDGAEDPAHAAMSFEARWRSGKTPDEAIGELKEQIRRLENEWREMKVERDEALAAAPLRTEGP